MVLPANLRLLVVDDFSTMRRSTRDQLEELGFTNVEEAEDGVVALSKLRLNAPFDFVISDTNMPNMNGFELVAFIKAYDQLKHLPVLLVTAEARKEDIILASQCGATGFIVKPFTRDTLEAMMLSVLVKSAAT